MKIKLENLRHTYAVNGQEPRTVLDIDHWEVEAGTQLLLRGISGSGKTTLLNILAGLLPPSAGGVWLDQRALYSLREAQRDRWRAQQVGYVFQLHFLVPMLSALENVEMALVFSGKVSTWQRRRQAQAILNQVGLQSIAHHHPHQLSTGQRLRVAVARALVHQPQLVLADEPTAALDQETGAAVMNLLQELCQQRGATLLVASHDPALNQRFEQTLDLRNGKLFPSHTAKVNA
jgi:ABC-type lipoprotein export system ATPase subunit